MTKKRNIWLLTIFMMLAGAGIFLIARPADPLLPISLKALQASNGWGYEIAVDGKPFIRQTNIPAVGGNVGFATKQQALLVGNKAVLKLKNGQLPNITVAELKQWGIIKETSL